MNPRHGQVFFATKLTGEITETDQGYVFAYDGSYLQRPDTQPVSMTVPLQRTTYASPTLFPFFSGLLAEGSLAEIQCRTLRIDERNVFDRLLATCRDTNGAVTVRPREEA